MYAPTKLKFNIVSYNCRGLPKDKKKLDLRPDIQHLFKDNEIICLQETWFAKQDLKYINNLNKPFQGVAYATRTVRRGSDPASVTDLHTGCRMSVVLRSFCARSAYGKNACLCCVEGTCGEMGPLVGV